MRRAFLCARLGNNWRKDATRLAVGSATSTAFTKAHTSFTDAQLSAYKNGCLPILWKNAFVQDPCKWYASLELQDAYRGFNPMPHKACLRNGALWGIFVNVQQTFRKSSDTVSPNL